MARYAVQGWSCLLALAGLASLTSAMCPFARMMNQYNFSGEWTMQHPENENVKYLLHVCHPEGNEIFFGISYFSEPNWLIGFGGGNWSQWNMGIGGMKYMLNGENSSIEESGFIVTMNEEGHRWYMKDLKFEYDLDISNQDYGTHDLCAVPYGFDKRVEKNWKIRQVLKKKRYIPREIERREKKILKLEKRNENGQKNEKISKLKDEISELKKRPQEEIKDDINPDLVVLPTLYNKTYANDQIKVTFVNNNSLCVAQISDQVTTYTISNVSSWYGGVTFWNNWNKSDGSFGTQFFIQYESDKILMSSVALSEEKNDEMKRGYSSVLSLKSEDEAIECHSDSVKQTQNERHLCDSEGGDHCEL